MDILYSPDFQHPDTGVPICFVLDLDAEILWLEPCEVVCEQWDLSLIHIFPIRFQQTEDDIIRTDLRGLRLDICGRVRGYATVDAMQLNIVEHASDPRANPDGNLPEGDTAKERALRYVISGCVDASAPVVILAGHYQSKNDLLSYLPDYVEEDVYKRQPNILLDSDGNLREEGNSTYITDFIQTFSSFVNSCMEDPERQQAIDNLTTLMSPPQKMDSFEKAALLIETGAYPVSYTHLYEYWERSSRVSRLITPEGAVFQYRYNQVEQCMACLLYTSAKRTGGVGGRGGVLRQSGGDGVF